MKYDLLFIVKILDLESILLISLETVPSLVKDCKMTYCLWEGGDIAGQNLLCHKASVLMCLKINMLHEYIML